MELIFVSDDKNVYILVHFNIDLLKCESSQISQDFLLSLRSSYGTSATLIDDIFVNSPYKLLASGNIIIVISGHFSSQRQPKINLNKLKI